MTVKKAISIKKAISMMCSDRITESMYPNGSDDIPCDFEEELLSLYTPHDFDSMIDTLNGIPERWRQRVYLSEILVTEYLRGGDDSFQNEIDDDCEYSEAVFTAMRRTGVEKLLMTLVRNQLRRSITGKD